MAADRNTMDPQLMDGKPCIRGMRIILGMLAQGHTAEEIPKLSPYLEAEDISQALR